MATLEEVTAAALEAMAGSGVAHALAGGLAANLWVAGEHQQATFDVDFAVLAKAGSASVADRLAERLAALGCFRSATLFRKATVERLLCPPEITVDLVQVKDAAYGASAIARSGTGRFRSASHPILRPEDVILHKSLARRPKDVASIAYLAADNRLDLEYLERWARRLGTWGFVRRSIR